MGLARTRVFYWIAPLILIFILEGTSSVFLFRYYAFKQTAFTPESTATGFLMNKALSRHSQDTFEVDNPGMFQPDAVLGYTTVPGVYRIIETSGARKHGYRVMVPEAGVRATSYHPVAASRRIYIFGNSTIWGFGLDDEMTAPWFLQAQLPDYQVINQALTSYTHVHQLLQYRRIRENLHPDDIVVFSYAANNLIHDVADPGWLKADSHGYELYLGNKPNFGDVKIPYANLSGEGSLTISYIQLVCAPHESSKCNHDMPEGKVIETIGIKIFEEISRDPKCRILVAFFYGEDSDPVIASLRAAGVPIVDLRPRQGGVDDDDYLLDGGHRGAFAHFKYHELLLDAFLKNKMIASYE
jgi:hypothetical protein